MKYNISEIGLVQITCDCITSSRWRSFLCHRDADEMPTCRGYPSAGGPHHPKSRGNKGTGRNNKQEILGGAARQPSILVSCAQSLFALRTLQHHGLTTDTLHTVIQATVVDKLSYASPAWWGLTSAADCRHLEAFLSWLKALGFQRCAQYVLRLTTNCSRRLRSAHPPSSSSLTTQA